MFKSLLSILLFFSLISASGQNAFITTWKTDNPGNSDNKQITIPTYVDETYNYDVNWGDGTSNSGVMATITHTYTQPGSYQVSISGDFPRIYFKDAADREKIINVNAWGDFQWKSMEGAFEGCINLDVLATDTPDLSLVTSLQGMFANGHSLVGNTSFNSWDVSHIKNMKSLFHEAYNFKQDLGNWDVSQVTDMSGMFNNNSKFNGAIGNWNVSKVSSMQSMFIGCNEFDRDIGKWYTGNVTSMTNMFRFAFKFNQDIGNWNVSTVATMQNMFDQAISFNQNLSNWDVSNVKHMGGMFSGADSFNQDLGNWNVSQVRTFSSMFAWASNFDQDLGGWNIGEAADINRMFADVTLSTKNYDALLKGWANLPSPPKYLYLDAGNSQYCKGEIARQKLIVTYNWRIDDRGANCLPDLPAFITTWKTDNPGNSKDDQITIPTYPEENYDYSVDWGDGTSDAGITSDITHTYSEPGTYEVSISGIFPGIYFGNGEETDRDKIVTVENWGNTVWETFRSSFNRCSNL